MKQIVIYVLLMAFCFSCAIHDKFPYICFYPQCVKQQFSLKTLKHNMQLAFGAKKRKHHKPTKNATGKPVKKTAITTGNENSAKADSTAANSVSGIAGRGIGIQDTLIKINYRNLTDSVRNYYRNVIHSYIKRCGTEKIMEVNFTDVYAEEGTEEESLYSDFRFCIINEGISRHRIFKSRNRHKGKSEGAKPGKKLLFLEIRLH